MPGFEGVLTLQNIQLVLLAPCIAPPRPQICIRVFEGHAKKHENVNLPHVHFAVPLSWDSWLLTMSQGECGEISHHIVKKFITRAPFSPGHASYLLAMSPLRAFQDSHSSYYLTCSYHTSISVFRSTRIQACSFCTPTSSLLPPQTIQMLRSPFSYARKTR